MRNILFNKDSETPYSDVFTVTNQVTVVGLGFENPDDYVKFNIVKLSASKPLCPCPPYLVETPNVVASAPLLCCGEEVRVSLANPFVIIDAPQKVTIQAVYVSAISGSNYAEVGWSDTNTANVNDRMRGCPCQ